MDYKKTYKRVERRYFVAAILLLLLFFSRQIVIQREIDLGKDMSRIINISGRQRMLSQRITKDILMLYGNENSDTKRYYLNELQTSLTMFEKSQYELIGNNENKKTSFKNREAIVTKFNEINPYFINILESGNKIIEMSKQTDYNNSQILEEIEKIIKNENLFLEKMDQIVFQYDNDANTRILEIEKLELIVFYLIIFVVLFITTFIFIPATRTLRQAFIDISESNKNITKLFYSLSGALFLVDEYGNLINNNSDALELMTLNGMESKNANISKIVRWIDINIINEINNVLSSKKLDNKEIKILDKNENTLILLLSAISGRYDKKEVVLISAHDITLQKKAEEILKDMAIKDELTGIYNRHFLDLIIETEFERSNRYKYPICAAILDIDDFKKINDTWGHPVGDSVLKEIAKMLRENSRESDYLIRIGGEEFIILMPHTDLEGGYIVAEKIRKSIEENNHPIVGRYTVSLGVAEKKNDETYLELYNRVDKALYKAKESGKNRVVKSIIDKSGSFNTSLE